MPLPPKPFSPGISAPDIAAPSIPGPEIADQGPLGPDVRDRLIEALMKPPPAPDNRPIRDRMIEALMKPPPPLDKSKLSPVQRAFIEIMMRPPPTPQQIAERKDTAPARLLQALARPVPGTQQAPVQDAAPQTRAFGLIPSAGPGTQQQNAPGLRTAPGFANARAPVAVNSMPKREPTGQPVQLASLVPLPTGSDPSAPEPQRPDAQVAQAISGIPNPLPPLPAIPVPQEGRDGRTSGDEIVPRLPFGKDGKEIRPHHEDFRFNPDGSLKKDFLPGNPWRRWFAENSRWNPETKDFEFYEDLPNFRWDPRVRRWVEIETLESRGQSSTPGERKPPPPKLVTPPPFPPPPWASKRRWALYAAELAGWAVQNFGSPLEDILGDTGGGKRSDEGEPGS